MNHSKTESESRHSSVGLGSVAVQFLQATVLTPAKPEGQTASSVLSTQDEGDGPLQHKVQPSRVFSEASCPQDIASELVCFVLFRKGFILCSILSLLFLTQIKKALLVCMVVMEVDFLFLFSPVFCQEALAEQWPWAVFPPLH